MSSQQPYIPIHQQPSSTAQAAAAISAYLSGAASIVFPSQHVAQEYSSQALAGAGIAAGGAGPDGLAWRQARAIEALLLQSGQQGTAPAVPSTQGQHNWPISSWNAPALSSTPFFQHQLQPIQSQQQTFNLMQHHLSLQAQFGPSHGLSPLPAGLSVQHHQHQPQSYAPVHQKTSPVLSAGSPSEGNNEHAYGSSSGESSTSSPLLSIASLSQRSSTAQPTIYTASTGGGSTVDPFELALPAEQEQGNGMSFKDLFGFSPAVAFGGSFAAGGPPTVGAPPASYTECVSPSFPSARPTSPWVFDLSDQGEPFFDPPGTDDLPSSPSPSPVFVDDDARSAWSDLFSCCSETASPLFSLPETPSSDENSPSNVPSFTFNPLPASNAVYAPESVGSFSSPGTSTPAPTPAPTHASGAPDPINAAAAHFAYNQSLNSLNPAKRHVCPVCARGFARAFNLKSHLATHDQNRPKPFACPHEGCGRGFSRSHDLERHRVGIHLGEFSYLPSAEGFKARYRKDKKQKV